MILVSPTAFKGTLTPHQAARIIAAQIKKKWPSQHVRMLPLADGGDGTLEVLIPILKAKRRSTRVMGPLGNVVRADWACAKKTAVIEIANASGLKLVAGKKRPLHATSTGTGQLIKAALNAGCKTILIGVGGTASSDGGAGALHALGWRYFDSKGKELSAAPHELIHVARMDRSHADPRLATTTIIVLCDVKNPLLGRRGSARTFGPQKGASPRDVLFLEKFLKRWASFAPTNARSKPGSGAAGALAFGLSAFLGAQLVDGAERVMTFLAWKKAAGQADIIISGEGRLDQTSFAGKVVGALARHRGRAKLFILSGTNLLSRREWERRGISGVVEMGKQGIRKPGASLAQAATLLIGQLKKEII
jgi:glycerate 2-kinase